MDWFLTGEGEMWRSDEVKVGTQERIQRAVAGVTGRQTPPPPMRSQRKQAKMS